MAALLAHVPLHVRQHAKAFVGGAVAAVVAAEAPLVQGGHWSATTVYAAALSALGGYALVYLKANEPHPVDQADVAEPDPPFIAVTPAPVDVVTLPARNRHEAPEPDGGV